MSLGQFKLCCVVTFSPVLRLSKDLSNFQFLMSHQILLNFASEIFEIWSIHYAQFIFASTSVALAQHLMRLATCGTQIIFLYILLFSCLSLHIRNETDIINVPENHLHLKSELHTG